MKVPYSEMPHNATSERIVEILKKKTGNIHDSLFFRVMTGFYMSMVASKMRTFVLKYDKQAIPVNMYALNLMPSGYGKGHCTNILEEALLDGFRQKFLKDTFPIVGTQNITEKAQARSIQKETNEEEELEAMGKEYEGLGEYMYSFSEGTPAALKQFRNKLLMGGIGSINFSIDEIGSNLIKNHDMLDSFLELYDVGKIKQKLVKNTAENIRLADMDGKTPANLVMYGTPVKLLDGGKTEDTFQSFLETGYGRRCFFGYVDATDTKYKPELSPEEMYDNLMNSSVDYDIGVLSAHFEELANPENYNKTFGMSRHVAIELIAYEQECKVRASQFPPHDEISRAEMTHRYFKVLKLAGAYAFCEGSARVEMHHLYSAIRLAEDSGEAFRRILTRDKPYVRLAKYIATCGQELTQADLVEDCIFYKGNQSVKNEMLNLAIAYGYKNNIVIKKTYNEGVEFISGEALEETNLEELIVSHSADMSYNFFPELASFDQLHKLTQIGMPDGLEYNFCNHHLKGGHRVSNNAIKGFNMIILDVDGSCSLDTAKMLLKDYKWHMYTTKSHQKEGKGDRYRIILPISHKLNLGADEFKEYMNNVYEWLPFDEPTDEATGQRVCKWASNEGEYWYNDGKLLDALQFIPATTKNEERKKASKDLGNLDNLERWFAMRMTDGQRNNQMVKFALMLVDSGMPFDDVEEKVNTLNAKLADPLPEEELATTVLKTAAKRWNERG